jgi:hypothetical protein
MVSGSEQPISNAPFALGPFAGRHPNRKKADPCSVSRAGHSVFSHSRWMAFIRRLLFQSPQIRGRFVEVYACWLHFRSLYETPDAAEQYEISDNSEKPAKSMQERNRTFFQPAFKQSAVQFVSLSADFACMDISLV